MPPFPFIAISPYLQFGIPHFVCPNMEGMMTMSTSEIGLLQLTFKMTPFRLRVDPHRMGSIFVLDLTKKSCTLKC